MRAGAKARARSVLVGARVLAGRGPTTVYIGWAGQRNLGDEAMLSAHRTWLPSTRLVQATNGSTTTSVESRSLQRRVSGVLLGGGTLIGNGHFRDTLQRLARTLPGAPHDMLAVGVEDPSFSGTRRRDVAGELELWTELLAEFPVVRVRGPLSQRALADVGVSSVVTGDPALLLGPGSAVGRPVTSRICVNIGVVDEMWGDMDRLVDEVVGFSRDCVRQGFELVFLSVWPKDTPLVHAVHRAVGAGTVFTEYTDAERAIDLLSGCDVVVSHKLHAAVLAACAGTPAIAMEYRPKCLDFQMSVGRDAYSVRTDQVSRARLLELLERSMSALEVDRADLADKVGTHKRRLQEAAEQVDVRLAARAAQ